MRSFGTHGRVYPAQHYVVPRTEEVSDFIRRIEAGKYIVLFAPRQTGKTTFFRLALERLGTQEATYFPIQLNFESYADLDFTAFYRYLCEDVRTIIESVCQRRGVALSSVFRQFLESAEMTDHVSMRRFFERLPRFLTHEGQPQKVVLIIDEFDGIPQTVVRGFLHALRHIYLSDEEQCPHSVGIIGVKSIAQLDYDRSVSPFNIQDEFKLPNFTLPQVQDLFQQYTDEAAQPFAPAVIAAIHKQTAGQPFLVNRFGQLLTEELDIPKNEMITMAHFSQAHAQLLRERNTNIVHLTTNIRRDPRFERLLMRIMTYEEGVDFNLHNDTINELATYGVIKACADGMCEILNPVYLYCILQTFTPAINGLEEAYFPEDIAAPAAAYLTHTGEIDFVSLLDNFRDFIVRVGFQVLEIPETPRESVGRHLLLAYLDQFVRLVGGVMHIEVQTGRGRMDLIITHQQRKYIVETKVWRGDARYQAGKRQLAAYLQLENATEGYYVVFDHRQAPAGRVETETIDGVAVRSYVIPVVQEPPSAISG